MSLSLTCDVCGKGDNWLLGKVSKWTVGDWYAVPTNIIQIDAHFQCYDKSIILMRLVMQKLANEKRLKK